MPELPPGWTIRTGKSRTGRPYLTITAPDGARCSWYDDGDLRVHKPGHQVQLGDVTTRHDGDSAYINFVPQS